MAAMTRRLFFPISFSDQKTPFLADNRLLSPVDQLELKYGLITFRQLFAIPSTGNQWLRFCFFGRYG
jgi:hypothetical protein